MTKSPDTTLTRGELTRFFAPLGLQTATQGLTHTIVAMVASRGEGGVMNFAGLTQAYKVMFFLGAFGTGLVTAGLVFGKTRAEFRVFTRVCAVVIGSIAGIHFLMNIPAVSHLLFGTIIGLPPAIENPARTTFFAIIPMQILFMLRTPFFAVLLNNHATGRAYVATLGRIVVTVLLALIFVRIQLVGVFWAVVCMTLPVALELIGLFLFARPFIRALPEFNGERLPTFTTIFGFSSIFSFGKVLIAMSDWILVAFIARAPQPERMLSVYAVVSALAAPVGFAATRLQAVYVSFAQWRDAHSRKVLRRFTVVAGLVLGCIPLVLILPGIIDFYYGVLQKVDAGDLQLVVFAALAFFPFPLLVGLRSAMEGKAAESRRPATVLAGNSMYLAFTTITAFLMLTLGIPGNVLGQIGLLSGNACAAMTMYVLNSAGRMRRIRQAVDFSWFR